jgi:hypothetical protein
MGQQKVLSHFPVCCWIDWLLMIKTCLIESGPPCTIRVPLLPHSCYMPLLSHPPRLHYSNNIWRRVQIKFCYKAYFEPLEKGLWQWSTSYGSRDPYDSRINN